MEFGNALEMVLTRDVYITHPDVEGFVRRSRPEDSTESFLVRISVPSLEASPWQCIGDLAHDGRWSVISELP